MKKVIRYYQFLLFFLLFFAVQAYATTSVNENLLEKINSTFDGQLTNNDLSTKIREEIDALKKESSDPLCISDPSADYFILITPEKTPTIFHYIVENIWMLCTAANIKKVNVYLRNSLNQGYNSYTGYNSYNQEPFIGIDEQLINLLLQPSLRDCLFAIIAHELGHIFHKTFTSLPQHEYLADEFACKLLKNSPILIKALAIRNFADYLFASLQSFYKTTFNITTLDPQILARLHAITQITTCQIINNSNNLGTIGQAPTNKAFQVLIYVITITALKNVPEKKFNQSTAEEISKLLYRQFLSIMNGDDHAFLNYLQSNQSYCQAAKDTNSTHPTLTQRIANIQEHTTYATA